MERNILKANTVNYRKGFIEVKGEIHPGCINIETWEIDANKDITKLSLESKDIKDEDITASTEIELSVEDAKKLIYMLEKEIEKQEIKKT